MNKTLGSLEPYQLRALHSFAVDACLKQDDDDMTNLLLQLIGPDCKSFSERLDDDTLQTTILVDNRDRRRVYVRLLVLGEDGQYHGLTHPPAELLGLNGVEIAALAAADYAIRGMDAEQFDVVDEGQPGDFNLRPHEDDDDVA